MPAAGPLFVRDEPAGPAPAAHANATSHSPHATGSPSAAPSSASNTAAEPHGKPTPSASNDLEHSGEASSGATATLSAETPKGTCTFDNPLSPNQQASWTDTIVNTCCTATTMSTCWYRIQAKAEPSLACQIPDCDELFSNDPDKMLGFRPLSGSNGIGKYGNSFPILFLSAAARPTVHLLLLVGITELAPVHNARAQGSPLGRFAAVRARLPRAPTAPVSLQYGAGMHSARAFSTGPAGGRLFENMVSNAPLALRALGSELDDEWRTAKSGKAAAPSPFAYMMSAQRWGVQQTKSMVNALHSSANGLVRVLMDDMDDESFWLELHPELGDKRSVRPASPVLESESCMQDDIALLFPTLPPAALGPAPGLVTRLLVPMEPDLGPLLAAADNPDAASEPGTVSCSGSWVSVDLLDDDVKHRLRMMQAAFRLHRERMCALEELLREHRVWPSHLTLEQLQSASRSEASPMILQVVFDGWSKDAVLRVLQARLGPCDWVMLVEEPSMPLVSDGSWDSDTAEQDTSYMAASLSDSEFGAHSDMVCVPSNVSVPSVRSE
ncbi:hypothetical protein MSPP1_002729 [Malassezia sp. CBS 17886]|nr:hypothetical protein MSPP1_002729 [Malassezia sp. CBS 17886]